MDKHRRTFLKRAAGGAAAVVASSETGAFPRREELPLPPNAIGMLYDSTMCIGCRACVTACKEANDMPVEQPAKFSDWNQDIWDTAEDLSGRTLNVIQVYTDGTKEQKDEVENGYAFVKRHCLHCVDPSCVSVCPVSAMIKDPDTGVVTHDRDACIGCRYCVYGCPFGVPQYEFHDPFGQITKCQFCIHLQKEGRLPACCDVCPTGASLFGLVEELQQEAEQRLAAKPGEPYVFPRGKLGDDKYPPHEAPLPEYEPYVYGVTESGGTQVRYLTGVPHEKLGLPKVQAALFASIAEGMQHTLYKGMIAPLALLAGLMYFAKRSTRQDSDDED